MTAILLTAPVWWTPNYWADSANDDAVRVFFLVEAYRRLRKKLRRRSHDDD